MMLSTRVIASSLRVEVSGGAHDHQPPLQLGATRLHPQQRPDAGGVHERQRGEIDAQLGRAVAHCALELGVELVGAQQIEFALE